MGPENGPHSFDGSEWSLLRSLTAYLSISIPIPYNQPGNLTPDSILSTNLEDAFNFELTWAFIRLSSRSDLDFPTTADDRSRQALYSLCRLLNRLVNVKALDMFQEDRCGDNTQYSDLRQLLKYVQTSKRQLNIIRGNFGPAFILPPQSSLPEDLQMLRGVNHFLDSSSSRPSNETTQPSNGEMQTTKESVPTKLRQYILTTFETVFAYLGKCETAHKILLGIPAPAITKDSSTEISLDVFISACPSHLCWQEARFGKTEFNAQDIIENDLCAVINECQDDEEGLLLHVIESELKNFSQVRQKRQHGGKFPNMSLHSLLADNLLQRESAMNIKPGRWSLKQRKLLLSIMAKALQYFLNSQWMSREWTSKDLFFGPENQDSSKLPLGPFVSFSADGPGPLGNEIWRDQLPAGPSLILFGMMMMEIDLGRSLERELNELMANGKKIWPALFDIFEKERNDLEYPELIEECLKFHKVYKRQSQQKGVDEASLEAWTQEYVAEYIVPKLGPPSFVQSVPLEQQSPKIVEPIAQGFKKPTSLLGSMLGTGLEVQTCDLISLVVPPYSQGSSQTSRTSTPFSGLHEATVSSVTNFAEDSKIQSPEPEPIRAKSFHPHAVLADAPSPTRNSQPDENGMTFNVSRWFNTDVSEDYEVFFDGLEVDQCSSANERKEASLASDFFAKTAEFNRRNVPRAPASRDERIKIAVIDTGVNLNDVIIKPHKSRLTCRNWVGDDEQDVTDICGHGTHIVRVMLQTTSSADIFIAKISDKKDEFSQENVKNIVEAINWAVKEGVHIISLSLGFLKEKLEIKEALQEAMSPEDENAQRTIVFAASGNYGFLQSRPYPAKQDGVICIHALRGNGTDSNINPIAPPEDRIGTLGVTIESRLAKEKVWITGSSFATPIAAAAAANLLQYGKHEMKLDTNGIRWRILCSCQGMRAVMKRMCGTGHHYSFFMPWQLQSKDFTDGRKDFPTKEELSKAIKAAIDFG